MRSKNWLVIVVVSGLLLWFATFLSAQAQEDDIVYLPAILRAATPTPTVVPPPDNVRLTAGYNHTCTITGSGAVKCWGGNDSGQLGDGTIMLRRTPVDVIGLDAAVTSIAAGLFHTCAVTGNGGVKCWGSNYHGQLGDSTQTERFTPVNVIGLESGVTALAAGGNHTCALTTNGGVKCWGYNANGQLGDGTQETRLLPVDVSGLDSGVVAITAAHSHTCALTNSGGVKCWGWNFQGQLGDGTTTDRLTPVNVTDLASGIKIIAAGDGNTCAVTNQGGVKCWGWNAVGQSGNSVQSFQSIPRDVDGLTSGVKAIAAGNSHACAVTENGAVKCWGYNRQGQLGDSTTVNRYPPVDVSGLNSGFIAITAGNSHTCASTESGGIRCWGGNDQGQIGDGKLHDRLIPDDVLGLEDVSKISILSNHTCALTSSGGVKCWGENRFGQLGDGTTIDRFAPAHASGLESGVIDIAVGYGHTCAVTNEGGVKCWGLGGAGQLGNGTRGDQLTPVFVSGLESGIVAIAAGISHTCAVTNSGGVKCWGSNESGQLGNGTQINQLTPVDVVGLTSAVIDIKAGGSHTCALTSGGAVKCWGSNFYGSLGDGSDITNPVPVAVKGLESRVTALAAGNGMACALISDGGVKCWGINNRGQLGDGTQIDRNVPVTVSGLERGISAIGAGANHACAVTTTGGVKCWGENYYGKLGDGSNTTRLVPVDVAGLNVAITSVDAGEQHTCAVTSTNEVKCWGRNDYGQLGMNPGWAPVTVVGFEGAEP